MKEYYTREQAMELLRLKSINSFLQLVRKYPDVFVNVHRGQYREKNPWYDRATLDKFHQMREHFKQEKP